MKIISKGKEATKLKSLVRFTCPVCDSELEAYKDELTPVVLENERYCGFICPSCCGQVAVKECDLKAVRGVVKDPDFPCDKKGCDDSTRASCCGCPEMREYERKKKRATSQ